MSRQLPFAQNAYVDRAKIVDYLLAPTHPEGWSKARFFSGLGFKAENWQVLAEVLREVGVANPVVDNVESAYGNRYLVDGVMETPSGRTAKVRTVWLIDKQVGYREKAPRLITAYPV